MNGKGRVQEPICASKDGPSAPRFNRFDPRHMGNATVHGRRSNAAREGWAWDFSIFHALF